MIATVTSLSPLKARVRRASVSEGVDQYRADDVAKAAGLKVGDRIEVKRVANNPYLVIVGKAL